MSHPGMLKLHFSFAFKLWIILFISFIDFSQGEIESVNQIKISTDYVAQWFEAYDKICHNLTQSSEEKKNNFMNCFFNMPEDKPYIVSIYIEIETIQLKVINFNPFRMKQLAVNVDRNIQFQKRWKLFAAIQRRVR